MSQPGDPDQLRSPTRVRALIILPFVLLPLLVLFVAAENGHSFTAYIPRGMEYKVEAVHYRLGNTLAPESTFSTRIAGIYANSRGFRSVRFALPKPWGVFWMFVLGEPTTYNTNDLSSYGNEEGLYYLLVNQYIRRGFVPVLLGHMPGWSYTVQELRFTQANRLNVSLVARDSSDSPAQTASGL